MHQHDGLRGGQCRARCPRRRLLVPGSAHPVLRHWRTPEAALLPAADDPDYNLGLALTLEESRNDLRAMVAPLYVGIVWLKRGTCNCVDLCDDDSGSRGGGEGTNADPSGIKDG
jgi:hypothetical protein